MEEGLEEVEVNPVSGPPLLNPSATNTVYTFSTISAASTFI